MDPPWDHPLQLYCTIAINISKKLVHTKKYRCFKNLLRFKSVKNTLERRFPNTEVPVGTVKATQIQIRERIYKKNKNSYIKDINKEIIMILNFERKQDNIPRK